MEFDIYSAIFVILMVPLANAFWRWISGLIGSIGHPVAQANASGLAGIA